MAIERDERDIRDERVSDGRIGHIGRIAQRPEWAGRVSWLMFCWRTKMVLECGPDLMATVWVSTFEYGRNPFRVGVVLVFGLPRVGGDANRWALRRNTVGVGGMAIERDERDIRDERVTDGTDVSDISD